MIKLFYKLKNDPRIRNSLWTFIEKAISLFGLIFIISAVAKYTGPTIYGEITLAASIFVVLKTIAQLGMDQIYFKYASQLKPFTKTFFKNSIIINSIIYILISTLTIIIATHYSTDLGLYFILFTAVAYYFNTIDLMNAYFEGVLLSKINVLANTVGLVASLFVRYIVVQYNLDVLWLGVPIILFTVIPFFIRLAIFNKISDRRKINNTFRVKYKYIKYILLAGVPLTLAILSATINTQISSFVIVYLLDSKHVAFYSIAFVLAGSWCLVSITIIMSYLTSIYKIPNHETIEYISSSSKLLTVVIFLSFFPPLILYFFAEYIIIFLYGAEYYQSIAVFKVLLISQFFWVIGFYYSRLIIKFSGYSFLAYKTLFCTVLNAFLSFMLIKKYGIIGAAYSVLLVEILSTFFLNFIFKEAKLIQITLYSVGVKVKYK